MRHALIACSFVLIAGLNSCRKDNIPYEPARLNEQLSGRSASGTGNGKKTGTVKDIDGNTYKTIQIGSQVWMAENLKVTHYRNGDSIDNIPDFDTWNAATKGAWCYYANADYLDAAYGKLYNWYAVNDSRGLCPTGWHVPSYDEWVTLANYLGGGAVAGRHDVRGLRSGRHPRRRARRDPGEGGQGDPRLSGGAHRDRKSTR